MCEQFAVCNTHTLRHTLRHTHTHTHIHTYTHIFKFKKNPQRLFCSFRHHHDVLIIRKVQNFT